MLLAMLAGCAQIPGLGLARPQPSDASANDASAPSRSAARTNGGIDVVHLRFDVLRADIPIGRDGVRNARKIWNHVDELRIDPELQANLVRNGIRIGVARGASWPAINTILETADAKADIQNTVVQPGTPLSLEMGTVTDDRPVFVLDDQNRLNGERFDPGQLLVEVGYLVHTELGKCTDLEAKLLIREGTGGMEWRNINGVVQQVPAYDQRVFSNLAPVVTLCADEFLIIGPSELATNEYSLGGVFFTRKAGGRLQESILCITPRPFRGNELEPMAANIPKP